MSHYCEKHDPKGKAVASGGGSYCRFHGQELDKNGNPHCRICGVYICSCGGSFSRFDVFWKSRKWCDKGCNEYVDYSGDEMVKIFG